MCILKIENISKSFNGIQALTDVSFNVPDGKIVALIGPNGAGKTTLFNVINGLAKVDNGKVTYKNSEITSLQTYEISRMGIGRTFQNVRLFPQLSVQDNILLALHKESSESLHSALSKRKMLSSISKEYIQQSDDLLNKVGMYSKKDSLADDLSHGQRRLVSIIRALATNPALLLLDEPMSGVFPETILKLQSYMNSIVSEGTTIFFIEHNLRVVMDISDWIIVLNYGKKIAEGTPEEIKNKSEVIEAYLGSNN